ncbi:hypothetical protein BO99DRAFT_404260 [Aspergillus violaceofuscus CBS 115571]|uniref:Cysteine-rich transmembrane CYSTM domain-containing protein n=1 Tax=Aspergillus violaceofuscus (strain CBS 115571) TaxID=1450538 RepID=A0A2V5HMS0_ASPV1|nr:hypothetical protein BO99DRAFT_404260 [Aspergillus violaceofuscus CBS 115571]
MLGDSLFSWFSFSKQEPTNSATWDATTASIQNHQFTSPNPPSTESVVTEQPDLQENMTLRGGDSGDVCCGICAGILCFECCC